MNEAEALWSLLLMLESTKLSKTESLAATLPILHFVSEILSFEEVQKSVPMEIFVKYCEIAAKKLPVVGNQMKERSFNLEFMNEVHLLAKKIFEQCTKKGLLISTSPIKDLKQAIDSQMRYQPPRSHIWDTFRDIDWEFKDSWKNLGDTRHPILLNLIEEIRIYSKLPEKEKMCFYESTVEKTLMCSWQMMVPWISANIIFENAKKSVCPAFEILQNWIPVFDAILEMEDEATFLLEMVHEALFLITFKHNMSPAHVFGSEVSSFFGTGTKFSRLATLIHLGICVTSEQDLLQKICGIALKLFGLEIIKAPTLEKFLIWQDPQKVLHEMRKVWNFNKFDIFSRQTIFSCQTIQLLNFLLQESIKLAGTKTDDNNFFGVMGIGSTSKGNRFPFSDLEFFVLYQATEDTEVSFRSYLYFLFSIFEFFIIRFGELEFGFQLDLSEHILESPQMFIGTVPEIFSKNVQKIWFERPGTIACYNNPKVGKAGTSEIFTSFLNPFLINSDNGGRKLYGEYSELLKNFLETKVDVLTMNVTKLSWESGIIQKLSGHVLENGFDEMGLNQQDGSTLTFPQTRHLVALLIWMDILKKIKTLDLGKTIDAKLVCDKPLVAFAQCLKIFGNINTDKFGKLRHPSEIFDKAHKAGFISFVALRFLVGMLETSCKLRAKWHENAVTYQKLGKRRELSEFLGSEQIYLRFCHTLFGNMKESLSVMIFQKGFEKFHSWKSVMHSLSTDLVLHAMELKKQYLQERWMTCLNELPLADGTRESTIKWKQDKERILDCLLPHFSSSIFQSTHCQHTILVDRTKGSIFIPFSP
jgi:hypothetical protein